MAKNKHIRVVFEGVDEFNAQLDMIVNQMQNGVTEGLKKATQKTKELAIILAPENDGQLKSAIKSEVWKYVGKVYVNVSEVPYVGYVYFGTGEFAQLAGKGKTEWKVPKEKVTKDVSRYGWKLYQGQNGMSDYYIVHGQQPNPFLEKAFDASIQTNLDLIAQEVKLAIERCL